METIIPEEEIKVSFARSAGPGGQNVNKTNTKVLAYWVIRDSNAFSEEEKEKILNRYHTEILQTTSQETRSQPENRKRAIHKLNEMVRKALAEERERIPTQPTIASRVNRIIEKQRHSQIKELRKKPYKEED